MYWGYFPEVLIPINTGIIVHQIKLNLKLCVTWYDSRSSCKPNMMCSLWSDRTYSTGTTAYIDENILIIFPISLFPKGKQARLVNRFLLQTCFGHIKIKSLSASSPESDDFLPAALSLSGFGDWSLVLKGPWSSELVRRGLGRWTESDATLPENKRERRLKWQ